MSRLAASLAQCGAEIEILSLNPRKHRGSPEGPLPIHAIDIDTSRVLGPLLRSLWSGAPFIVNRFFSAAFADAVEEAVRRFDPDIVQIESPFMLPYAKRVRAISSARVVLRSLNVEFRIWEGMARNETNPVRRLALQRIATSLRKYEISQLNELDAIVPISEDDRDDFVRLGSTRAMHVVPCGITFSQGDNVETAVRPGSVGFIGSLDFRPNQNAVRWILSELWPRVTARAPGARLSIAGSAPPRWLLEYAADSGVDVHDNIDDAAAFMRGISVFVSPLFEGGGMRIKVLEAMALGKPVVATTIGAGGIAVRNGGDIVIADDTESFTDAVVRLLLKPAAAAQIGEAARARVGEQYDSDALARGLLRFYESL